MKFKAGDLVRANENHQAHGDAGWQEQYNVGIVISANIAMWDKRTAPEGVEVYWQGLQDVETVFSDEIELIKEKV